MFKDRQMIHFSFQSLTNTSNKITMSWMRGELKPLAPLSLLLLHWPEPSFTSHSFQCHCIFFPLPFSSASGFPHCNSRGPDFQSVISTLERRLNFLDQKLGSPETTQCLYLAVTQWIKGTQCTLRSWIINVYTAPLMSTMGQNILFFK